LLLDIDGLAGFMVFRGRCAFPLSGPDRWRVCQSHLRTLFGVLDWTGSTLCSPKDINAKRHSISTGYGHRVNRARYGKLPPLWAIIRGSP